jgi:hypothetical protein
MNRSMVPEEIPTLATVGEAKEALAKINSINDADWLVSALRHVEGFSASTESITEHLAETVNGLNSPELEKTGWTHLQKWHWVTSMHEVSPRILTAVMFNKADKDGKGTLNFK